MCFVLLTTFAIGQFSCNTEISGPAFLRNTFYNYLNLAFLSELAGLLFLSFNKMTEIYSCQGVSKMLIFLDCDRTHALSSSPVMLLTELPNLLFRAPRWDCWCTASLWWVVFLRLLIISGSVADPPPFLLGSCPIFIEYDSIFIGSGSDKPVICRFGFEQ